MKVYIRTFGCQMNDRDSEAVLGLFLDKGYQEAKSPEKADVIFVNTCSVREHAEDRAISFLGSLKKLLAPPRFLRSLNGGGDQSNYPKNRIIGLIGCMARNRGEEIAKRMPHVNLICGPACFDRIPEYVEKVRKDGGQIIDLKDKERENEFYSASYRIEPGAAQVVISTGCSNYCSYCVVPFVRGDLRLRDPKNIIEEVKRNVGLGVKKITLLGQNVNDYLYRPKTKDHRPETVNFVDLLKMVVDVKGIEGVDFITSQPRNTSRELFELMGNEPKIKKHLHLPFQSGSNRILKMMNRGYTREEYLDLVDNYKKIVKGTLSADVIVGFPTETDEDFQQTRDILERVKFKYAYIFKYSPRMRAKSAKIEDDVSSEVKAQRHKILLDLQKQISLSSK